MRLNDDEKRIRDARRKKFAWHKIQEEKIYLTRVFKAFSDACSCDQRSPNQLDQYQHGN